MFLEIPLWRLRWNMLEIVIRIEPLKRNHYNRTIKEKKRLHFALLSIVLLLRNISHPCYSVFLAHLGDHRTRNLEASEPCSRYLCDFILKVKMEINTIMLFKYQFLFRHQLSHHVLTSLVSGPPLPYRRR
jgi:hypothetical protein